MYTSNNCTFIRKCRLVIFLTGIGMLNLYSQNSLYIKENSGNLTGININNISKITFQSGSLMIHKTDKNTVNYTLNNIKRVIFNDNIDDNVTIENITFVNFQLYPNPASGFVQLSFDVIKEGSILIEIINMQGQYMDMQSVVSPSGSNQVRISIEQLPTGFYLVKIQNDKQYKSIKFYKE